MSGVPAVFVDRGGTVIREVGFLRSSEEIEVLSGVPEAIQWLQSNGFKVVLVTNQSGVARGFLQEKDLQRIHEDLKERLAASDAFLDGIYYCSHHPTEGVDVYRVACQCRKPNEGMALRAAEELNLDLSKSYVVGDQWSDMELAARIGAKGIFIDPSERGSEGLRTGTVQRAAKDLWEAAQWIVLDSGRG